MQLYDILIEYGKIENPENPRRKNVRGEAEGEHREGNERSC